MYRHIKTYEIKFTDTDPYDVLRPAQLLTFLEESACLSAEELHFGYADVAPRNLGFIMANWYVELYRPILLSEKLTVHTWPITPKKLIFLRDFELYVGEEKVGVCSSRWCMVDMTTFTPLPTSVYFDDKFDFYGFSDIRAVDFNIWKIPSIEGELAVRHAVSLSDYDHYFHVNNTKYADFFLDTLTLDELKGKFISKIQITYVKQCKIGDCIDLYRANENCRYIVEGKVDGERRVQFSAEISPVNK